MTYTDRATERNLFGWQDWPPTTEYPAAAGWKEPTTSREAALAISATAKTLRDNVLNVLMTIAPDALTADQIAIRLQRSPFSIRPRVSELAASGKIKPVEERGTNDSGMTARKWRLADA